MMKETMSGELDAVRQRLLVEEKQRRAIENEFFQLQKAAQQKIDDFEVVFFLHFLTYHSIFWVYGFTSLCFSGQ